MSSLTGVMPPCRNPGILHQSTLRVAVGFLFFIISMSAVAQVTIKERVGITPHPMPTVADSALKVAPMGGVPTTVLGIPLHEYLEAHPRVIGPDNPTEEEDSTIAIINPEGIYRNVVEPGETFFTASGTFDFPENLEEEYQLILHGGELETCCGTEFGLGADDDVIVKINGEVVFSYDLSEVGQFIFQDGLDVTSAAHPGTNTFEVTAFDTRGRYEGLPPMHLALRFVEPPTCLLVRFDPPEVTVGEVTSLIFEQLHYDGTVDSYPLEQVFQVFLSEGYEEYGDLICTATGDTSDWVSGLQNEIKFIAASSIPDDSITVRIEAYVEVPAWPMGGGGVGIVDGRSTSPFTGKRVSQLVQQASQRRKSKQGGVLANGLMGGECPEYFELVEKNTLDHFDVTFEHDTVAFTESSKIFVQAKNAIDQNFTLHSETLLTLSVETSEEYGTFIDRNGDTLKTTPVRLESVPYGDLRTGLIQFAAVKRNPDSVLTCRVCVELQGDESKNGDTTIAVVEQTLKILMDAPFEVLPTKLLGDQNQQATGSNRKPFTVRLTRNSRPVPSHHFVLTTDYVDRTGGHDHTTPRRRSTHQTQTRANYGYFILQRTNGIVDRPHNGTTQNDGQERFDYVASMFGDSMRIVVASADLVMRKFLRDSVTIAEKVPDLQLLGPGPNYDLIGGRCEHHGPGGVGACSTPNNNHWGTAVVVASMQNIATEYHALFPNGQQFHINDMSLPFGGRFDIFGRWEGYSHHQYHRQGTDVDVQSTTIPDDDRYRDLNRNGRYDRGEPITFDLDADAVYDYMNTAFENICRRNNVLYPHLEYPGGVGGPEHYHLYFHLYN